MKKELKRMYKLIMLVLSYISDLFYKYTYYLHRAAGHTKKMFKWFPIIWKTRDYDHGYLYDIIQFKINEMNAGMTKRDRFLTSGRTTEIMNTASKLIGLVNDGYYEIEYMDYYDRDVEFIKIICSDNYTVKINNTNIDFSKFKNKYKLQYKKILKKYPEISDEVILANKVARLNSEKAKRILFSILHDNIDKWWD